MTSHGHVPFPQQSKRVPYTVQSFITGAGTGRTNCALPLASRKINWFYPNLPLANYEEEWLLLTDYISTYLSWSFVLMRCCALTWVTKILMRAISNVHAGRRFPLLVFYLFRRWVVRIYQVHTSTQDASLPGVVMAYKFLKYPKSNALWIILTDKYSTIEQQKR